MEISTISYKRCELVKATGIIDSHSAPELENTFQAIIDGGKSGIVFDMDEVKLISSRGLWVLLETQKACQKKKGSLVLANVSPDMVKSFELAGIMHFIEIYNDITAAVGSF
jgi:anti-anti-sigma factor